MKNIAADLPHRFGPLDHLGIGFLMLFWFGFSLLLVIGLILGTLAWWRIGDYWADNEHKRFKEKPEPRGDGPRVITKAAIERGAESTPSASPEE